ncbi:MAG: hypothetical protein ABIH76_06865 [Candidatus Bathyarchaeota archaeon]
MQRTLSVKEKTRRFRHRYLNALGDSFPEISPSIVTLIILAGVIFLLVGGLYGLITSTPVFIGTPQGGISFFAPYDLNTQLPLEGAFYGIFLSIGILGGYLAHRSLTYRQNPRNVSIILFIAIALMVIGVLGANYLLQLKLQF